MLRKTIPQRLHGQLCCSRCYHVTLIHNSFCAVHRTFSNDLGLFSLDNIISVNNKNCLGLHFTEQNWYSL